MIGIADEREARGRFNEIRSSILVRADKNWSGCSARPRRKKSRSRFSRERAARARAGINITRRALRLRERKGSSTVGLFGMDFERSSGSVLVDTIRLIFNCWGSPVLQLFPTIIWVFFFVKWVLIRTNCQLVTVKMFIYFFTSEL